MLITISQGVDTLLTFPYLGKSIADESGRRELAIPFGSGAYVVRYRIDSQDILVIMRVWHGREERAHHDELFN